MTSRAAPWLTQQAIAHRGLHGPGAPELSREAIRRAIRGGYALEIDVRASRDGVLMALHDVDTERVTGVRLVIGDTDSARLIDLPLSGSGETVLTLSEVLAIVRGRAPLLIEVKHGVPAGSVGPLVVSAMSGYQGEWAIESFDPRIVRWFRRHAPQVHRGQLSGDLSAEPLPVLRRFLLETMAFNLVTRPDFIVYDVEALSRVSVAVWRTLLRCPVIAWTASTPEHVQAASRRRAGLIFENVRP